MKKLIFLFIFYSVSTAVFCQDKTFTIVTEEYPPYAGCSLENFGWTIEAAKAALELEGYDVYVRIVPWARAIHETKTGLYEGLYLAFKTEEREKYYLFSDPIAPVKTVFFKLKSRKINYRKLEDLTNCIIGTVNNAAYSDKFANADFLNKEAVSCDKTNLLKLAAGRIDLLAGSEVVIKHKMKKVLSPDEISRIEVMYPPINVNYMHMAVSKNSADAEQKLKDFNTGYKKIIQNGTYQKILRKHGF